MGFLTNSLFTFRVQALPADTFEPISFTGSEEMSRLYRFELLLVSRNPEIDLAKAVQSEAVLTIPRSGGDVAFHGILSAMEQGRRYGDAVLYRAVLVPKAWRLTLTRHNQIFLEKTLPEIIEVAFKDGGLGGSDYELRLMQQGQPRDYVCQYAESHFDFVSRWMEREGYYYYFEHTGSGAKMVVADSKTAHNPMPQGEHLVYSPPSGLDQGKREEHVREFVSRQSMLPAQVILKDYNYEKPSLEVAGKAPVSPQGVGDVYLYGDHFHTPAEGNRLAKIRAEEILATETVFHGESLVPYIRPGYTFQLESHYRRDFNRKYLTTQVSHAGDQTGYLIAGLARELNGRQEEPYYRNSFSAIPADVQYRSPQHTEKPRFHGTLYAKIDAEGGGQYAELDAQGRYKARLPMDIGGAPAGKATCWLRMAQPYAGTDHGMHFPLHKETEVLLTFIDGDPDRPIIAGAVPNPSTESVVNQTNATSCLIQTAGGNSIAMQDEEGKQRVAIGVGGRDAGLILGQGTAADCIPGSVLDPVIHIYSDVNTTLNKYFMGFSEIGSALGNSFSFRALSGSLLPSVIKNSLSQWAQHIKQQQLKGQKSTYPDYIASVIATVPTVMNVIIGAWVTRSANSLLSKEGATPRQGAPATTVFSAYHGDWDKSHAWKNRLNKLVSNMGKWSKTMAYTLGESLGYGASLIAHMPHVGDWAPGKWTTGIIDPRMAATLYLDKGAPNILIAASYGFVDVIGIKGVNLFSPESANIEGKQVHLNGVENVTMAAHNATHSGIVRVNVTGSDSAQGVLLEYGSSSLAVHADRVVSTAQKQSDSVVFMLDAGQKSASLAAEKIELAGNKNKAVTIGRKDKTGITMLAKDFSATAAGTLALTGEKAVNIASKNDSIVLNGSKAVKMQSNGNMSINAKKIMLDG